MTSIFEPISINSMNLPHRVITGPMERGMANRDGTLSQRYLDYIEARAAGGAGLILLESTYVDTVGMGHHYQVGCHVDDVVAPLQRAVAVVHRHGAKLGLELYLGGRQTPSTASQRQPVGPSVVPCSVLSPTPIPRVMTYLDMERVVASFRAAARRCLQAGVDMIHIHGAHGYLIGSFLSPFSNTRTDEFGGPLENRARFPLMIVEALRDEVGLHYPLGYRMSAEEHIPNGLHVDEAATFAGMLAVAGIDLIDVSGGIYEAAHRIIQGGEAPEGAFVGDALRVKAVVGDRVLVSVAQRLSRPGVAQSVVDRGVDMVSMTRAFHADPQYVTKLREGRVGEIVPCVGCHHCTNMLEENRVVDCAVNPSSTRERAALQVRSMRGAGRRVLVVGGGPAGMAVATQLQLAGDEVVLVEQADHLGGQLRYAGLLATDFVRYVDHATSQMMAAGVEVRLGQSADVSFVERMGPDHVVVATGAKGAQRFFEIDGLAPLVDVFGGFAVDPGSVRGTIVVAGAQGISCRLAVFLAGQGMNVLITDPANEIGLDYLTASRGQLQAAVAAQPGVVARLETTIELVGPTWVEVQSQGVRERIGDVGLVVVGGRAAVNDLADELARDARWPVSVIGDAIAPRTLHAAIHDAFRAGAALVANLPFLDCDSSPPRR